MVLDVRKGHATAATATAANTAARLTRARSKVTAPISELGHRLERRLLAADQQDAEESHEHDQLGEARSLDIALGQRERHTHAQASEDSEREAVEAAQYGRHEAEDQHECEADLVEGVEVDVQHPG